MDLSQKTACCLSGKQSLIMQTQIGTDGSPESELRFWLSITKNLPQVKGAGRVCGVVERIYNRKKRSDALSDVLGYKMLLDPADNIEHQLLFCPHLFDRKEISYLRKLLKPGDTFLDAGANAGFYSLVASGLVGDSGTVISVEAAPYTASRFANNIRLNNANNIRLVNVGLSDRAETLKLGLNTCGNRGGNSFLYDAPETISVECKTLTDVLLSQGVKKVHGAKMDIEGFEFKVLQKFFADGRTDLWPGFLLIEINPFLKKTGDVQQLLMNNGYELTRISELNYIATRR